MEVNGTPLVYLFYFFSCSESARGQLFVWDPLLLFNIKLILNNLNYLILDLQMEEQKESFVGSSNPLQFVLITLFIIKF